MYLGQAGDLEGMERLHATSISNPGEPIRAALRDGAVVFVALRLGLGEWEPQYMLCDRRRVPLPPGFCWTLEAIGTLEAAARMQ